MLELAGYRFIEWDTEATLRTKLRERLQTYQDRQEAS